MQMGRMASIARMARQVGGLALLSVHSAVCAIAKPLPPPSSLSERLDMMPVGNLPLNCDVTIYWSEHQIPFLEAERDSDLAVALGLVHAHLRLGQMEMMRHLARGRLSELVGPIAIDLDHLLRILDFGRAIPGILEHMPDNTRQWLEHYVSGINHYQMHATSLPHEFAVLGIECQPWDVADVLCIGRLVAADVNWIVWFQLLGLRSRKDWPRIWSLSAVRNHETS